MFTIDAHNVRGVTLETKQYNSTNWTTLCVETLDANNNIVVLRVNLFHPAGELALDASAFNGVVVLPPEDDAAITPAPSAPHYNDYIVAIATDYLRLLKASVARGEKLSDAQRDMYENSITILHENGVDWREYEMANMMRKE